MKRFHLHVSVETLDKSVQFYSALFGVQPSVLKDDYAKWMLDDPRINFAISMRGARPGLDHLGLQVDSAEELASLQQQLRAADMAVVSEVGTACCYAQSDKHWVTDPQGIAWETFHSLGTIPTFNQVQSIVEPAATCCGPKVVPADLPAGAKSACTPGASCC